LGSKLFCVQIPENFSGPRRKTQKSLEIQQIWIVAGGEWAHRFVNCPPRAQTPNQIERRAAQGAASTSIKTEKHWAFCDSVDPLQGY
jgi:hypothetical protein